MPTIKSEAAAKSPSSRQSALSKLGDRLKVPRPLGPVWDGPCSDSPQGGITQGLVQKWLVCPERFRIYSIEGLKVQEQWNQKLGYGNMWHVCEEAWAAQTGKSTAKADWEDALHEHIEGQVRENPMQRDDIEKWYLVCRTQFPVYIEHWLAHPDQVAKKTLMEEYAFRVPYRLPSGRIVYLRGKWDDVSLIEGERPGVWITDHKTKGEIDAQKIAKQLMFDIQTMFYTVALLDDQLRLRGRHCHTSAYEKAMNVYPFRGIRYNLIRRPLSGGRHTIRPHQPTKKNPRGESLEEYYARLGECFRSDPDYFFIRFSVDLGEGDVERFQRRCLDPILESMCDDYEWWSEVAESECASGRNAIKESDDGIRHIRFPHHARRTWVTPFGVYNPLQDRTKGYTDLDNYILTGDRTGLRRIDDLFPELAEAA